MRARKTACEFEIQSDQRHLPAMSLAFDPKDFSFVVKMRGAPAKAVREGKKALARLLMAA
jgi:hypothetical protein